MSLNFDPSIYERIAERKQNQDQQNRQQVADSLNSIPQSILAYGQQQQQKKQQDMQDRTALLNTGIAAGNAGYDPSAAINFVSGGGASQPASSQASPSPADSQSAPSPVMSPGPWSNPEPQGTPSADTAGAYSSPPSPSMGRGVLDHWDQQNPHLHSSTTLRGGLVKQQSDYGDVISKMAGGDYSGFQSLPVSQQKLIQEDPRYKQLVKPVKSDNLNFAQAKIIVPTLDQKSFDKAYPEGIPKDHLAMMSKPAGLSTMNTSTYDTAPADDQRLARNLVDGKIRPSDIGYRDRGRIVSLASEYADMKGKDFQSFGGDVKAGMAKNLAYGKMGQNVVSFNTALGHIGDADKSFQQVGNTNQRWLNTPLNALKKQTDDPDIIALDLNLHAVSGELATAFKGSGGTDQEIGHFASLLTDDLTPNQAHAALAKAAQLLNSRINAVQNQQSSVMESGGAQRNLLSPHASKVMDSFQDNSQEAQPTQVGRFKVVAH